MDRQKGEAGRRLNELDVQIVTLTNTLKDMQDKVALEQAHITQLRTESMISLENARVSFYQDMLQIQYTARYQDKIYPTICLKMTMYTVSPCCLQ